MSAFIQSIDSLTSEYFAESLQKTKENNDNSFSAVFKSALNFVDQTNDLVSAAEAEEIKMALGYTQSPHEYMAALTKSELAVQYTVAVKNKFLEAYKEIMAIQI